MSHEPDPDVLYEGFREDEHHVESVLNHEQMDRVRELAQDHAVYHGCIVREAMEMFIYMHDHIDKIKGEFDKRMEDNNARAKIKARNDAKRRRLSGMDKTHGADSVGCAG